MSALAGRTIVLGVSGGIAAYKSVDVLRRLIDAGAYVVPVMTASAGRFIGATTLSALASEPVMTSMWEGPDPIPHTRLGRRADVIVVAPATARLIGAYANGLATDLLTNTLIATTAPVVLAPAMHTEMWEHPAVVHNIATLMSRGVELVGPGSGRLAGGDPGVGRMAEPADIVARVIDVTTCRSDSPAPSVKRLDGLSVLVTAGGTREPIDPVRVLANRSSGKQGHAIAAEAHARGAAVTLITTVEPDVPSGVAVERVETAEQMADAVFKAASSVDVVVMAAAVADFRPKVAASDKLKKRDGVPEIVLEPTVDILAGVAAARRPGQTIVGFAAETEDVVVNATAKLRHKGLDVIVANDVSAPLVGFGHDTNAVTIIRKDHPASSVARAEKRVIAAHVLDAVVAARQDAPG
ncbi:bifunctional phosphopantothenoylcysteine decarboxylase/phosphopantothenate--cysteine ligase CoaBC [soil metagenome]